RGRRAMDDVHPPAWRSAAEQRRTRPFQMFDLLHAIEHAGKAAELVAVAETIIVELGVQAADQEEVEVVSVLAALDDATRIRKRVEDRIGALLIDDVARNDLNA